MSLKQIPHEQKSKNVNRSENILDLVFDNFNDSFNIKLSESCKDTIKSNSCAFFARYVLDFFVCNFVIAPAVISFWRGVWDYSLIYLEERLLNV